MNVTKGYKSKQLCGVLRQIVAKMEKGNNRGISDE